MAASKANPKKRPEPEKAVERLLQGAKDSVVASKRPAGPKVQQEPVPDPWSEPPANAVVDVWGEMKTLLPWLLHVLPSMLHQHVPEYKSAATDFHMKDLEPLSIHADKDKGSAFREKWVPSNCSVSQTACICHCSKNAFDAPD